MKITNQYVISNFKDGWLTFSLGKYQCSASFLEKVPELLLDACIERMKNPYKIPVVKLDEEDAGETYVIFDYNVFIVKNERVYYMDNLFTTEDFAVNLIDCVENNIDEIIEDFYCGIYKSYNKELRTLKKKIKTLQQLIGFWRIQNDNRF